MTLLRSHAASREFPSYPRKLKERTRKKQDARFVSRMHRRLRRELDRHDAAGYPANRAFALQGPIRSTPLGYESGFCAWPHWAQDRPPWWEDKPEYWVLRQRKRDERWIRRQRKAAVRDGGILFVADGLTASGS